MPKNPFLLPKECVLHAQIRSFCTECFDKLQLLVHIEQWNFYHRAVQLWDIEFHVEVNFIHFHDLKFENNMSHICILIKRFTTLTSWSNVWLCAVFWCIRQLFCAGMWMCRKIENSDKKLYKYDSYDLGKKYFFDYHINYMVWHNINYKLWNNV